MLRILANILAYLFHPLLMPTYLFGVIGYFSPAIFQATSLMFFIIIIVFFLTAALPVLNLLLFRLVGTVQNLQMPTRRERVGPFLFIAVLYIGVTVLFYLKIPVALVVKLMMISSALVALIATCTLFIKISAHAVGVAGLTGILLALAAFSTATSLMLPAIICLVLSGVVMSGRLLQQAHTLDEVTWGGVLGLIVGFGGVLILF